jgi:tetratricopeptide (TPR) repeat protein
MRLEKYDEALKYYFKVEYLAPENDKIQHPIAWISFILGKFETAIKYYTRIIEKNSNDFDFIHLGHAHWCSGNLKDSIKCYSNAFTSLNGDINKFNKLFDEDQNYLIKHGIKVVDLSLMKDYIKNNSN